MRKKIITFLLVVTIIVQIAVPVGLLIHKSTEINNIKKYGQLCTFKGYNAYCYNGEIRVSIHIFGQTKQFAVVRQDENGQSYFEHYDEKPENPVYIDRDIKDYETVDFRVSFPMVAIKAANYKDVRDLYFEHRSNAGTDSETKVIIDENGSIPLGCIYYDELTVDAYVWKGRIYVEEIYVDGVEIETVLENLINRN